MSRDFTPIYTQIWQNEDFLALNMAAQRTYFMLISQPEITAAGTLPITARRWAKLAPEGMETLQGALRDLVAARFILADIDAEELWVRSFIKWDNHGYRNPKRRAVIAASWRASQSPTIKLAISEQMRELGHPVEAITSGGRSPRKSADRLSDSQSDRASDSQSHRLSATVETEQEQEQEPLSTLAQQAARAHEQSTEEEPTLTEVNSGRQVRVRKSEVDANFVVFWEIYPKKKSKQVAYRRFNALLQAGVDPTVIHSGARLVAHDVTVGNTEYQYVPFPATWLNAGGWEDEETRPAPLSVPAPMSAVQASYEAQRVFMENRDKSILR